MTQGPFRLVAADLDGTLLDPQGQLSPRTVAVAHALHDAGVVLALATSRRLTGAAPVAAALQMTGPLIIYDGAQVRQYPSREIIAEHPLERSTARQAVAILLARGLRPVVQYGDAVGERMLVGPAAPGDTLDELYLSQFPDQITSVSAAELSDRLNSPLRIVSFDALERLRSAADELAQLPCGWQLLPRGNYGTAELSVFSAESSKGKALTALAQRLEIPMAQVFAIGDGINDVSMLSVAGLGVAMGNGDRVARAAAQVVARPNSEDGAARAIARYVLESGEIL